MSLITYPRLLKVLKDVSINGTSNGDLFVSNGNVWINTKILTGSYQIIGSLTASYFVGDGQNIINIQTSSISNFNTNVRNLFSANSPIDYNSSNGLFSFNGVVTSIGDLVGSSNITITANGSDYTASLKPNISLTSVSASFSGSGRYVYDVTASNIQSFSSDVRKQVSAGAGLSYDVSNGVFSLLGSSGGDINTGTTAGLTASSQFFIACSGTTTSSLIDIQLPLISDIGNGKNYVIKNIGIGTVRVIASGSNKIDGAASASIYTQYSSFSLFGTGSNWWIY